MWKKTTVVSNPIQFYEHREVKYFKPWNGGVLYSNGGWSNIIPIQSEETDKPEEELELELRENWEKNERITAMHYKQRFAGD